MSDSDAPQNTEESPETEYYPRAAPIMAAATFVLFLGMITLLGYRWLNMAEPNGFILIQGTKEFNGADVTVTDAAGDEESHGLIKEENDYHMRIPLPQGTYRVLITMNDKAILRQSIELQEGSGMVFTLDNKSATQPTTDPGAE